MKINIRHFATNSTIPPIAFLARAKDKCLSVVWICVLIAFSTLSIVQSFQLLQKLNLREKYASVTITSQPLAPFPSVTICSINAYRRSALEALPEFKTYFQLLGMQSSGNQSSYAQNNAFKTGRKKRAGTVCPPNFTNVADDYPNICYTDVSNETRTFSDALLTCKASFPESTLPTFRTSLEYSSYQILMQTKYMKVCTTNVWFGLMSNQADNVFRWVDDASNMTFSHWDTNQPNQVSMAGVTHRSVGGNWKTYPLNSTFNYVCQIKILNATQTPKSIQTFQTDPRCSSGWTYDNISNICYSSRNNQTSWFSATSICAQLGPNVSLPYFCNSSEFNSYLQLLNQTPLFCNRRFWLGYSGCAGTSFIMANGQASPFLAFPSATQNYNQCVVFDFTKASTTNESWVSYGCSSTQISYFCQYRPSGSLCPNSEPPSEICDSTTTNPLTSVSKSTDTNSASSVTTSATQQTILPSTCPKNFTYTEDYPNLCYTGIVGNLSFSEAISFCSNLDSRANLPIFRTMSEHDSYMLLMQNAYMGDCWKYVWLGLRRTPSSSTNYFWVDGTSFNLTNLWEWAQPNLTAGAVARHGLSGRGFQSENENSSLEFVCQIRLSKADKPVKSVAIFQTDLKCPNANWIYDNISNICYSPRYTDKTWLDAGAYCSNVSSNTSLPYFCSYSEFQGYISYINQTILSCSENSWLLFGCDGNSFVQWNDSLGGGPYYAWAPNEPQINKCSVFNYLYTQRNQSWQTYDCSFDYYSYFCQYRPNGSLCLNTTPISMPCFVTTVATTTKHLSSALQNSTIFTTTTSLALSTISNSESSLHQVTSKQSPSNAATTSSTQSSLVENLMSDMDYKLEDDNIAQMSTMSEALAYIVGQLSVEERIKLGFQLDEMMLHCTFNKINCFNKDFVTWNEPAIGNCFTFNSRQMADRIQTNAGSDYGLELLFNTSSKDYVNSTLSDGLKLFLEHKSNAIFYDTRATSVPYGYFFDVPLKYKYVKRLGYPFGDCVSSAVQTANYFFEGSYTSDGCLKTCQQKSVLHQCGCFDPNLPAPKEANNRFCNITKMKCATSTLNSFESQEEGQNCTCHQACEDEMYSKTPTISKRLSLDGLNYSQVVTMKIYYTKLSYIILEESPAYDHVSFFTDVSNVLGTNVGAAFHSIFEILMIAFAFLNNLFA